MKFEVLREHIGEVAYKPGDVREAAAADVAHLVRAGVLAPAGEVAAEPPAAAPKGKKTKAVTALQDKSEPVDTQAATTNAVDEAKTEGGAE